MSSLISPIKVKHSGPMGAKLLIVGEAPGETEEELGEPFVGYSGKKLEEVLNLYSVKRSDVRLANLCNYRPDNNNFDHLVGHPLLDDGIRELDNYINNHTPNCILALGAKPLEYLSNRYDITSHRGSVLPYINNTKVKVYHAYHPSWILRNPDQQFIFAFDVQRAIDQSKFPEFPYRKRNIYIADNHHDYIHYTQIIRSKKRITIDIETTKKEKAIICVGFGVSADTSYVFPYNPVSEIYIHEIINDPAIEKCFHYGFCFDVERFFIDGQTVQGRIEDTYILSHVLQPSLPRGLDFLTSVYTFEPFYKTSGRATLPGDSKAWSQRTNPADTFIYNGKDCCVQYEVWDAMLDELTHEDDIETYKFDLEDAKLAQEIGRNGLPIDLERQQYLLYIQVYKWNQLRVAINIIARRTVNIGSWQQVAKLLYEDLELPKQYKHDFKKKKKSLSTDETSLVKLLTITQDKIDSYKTPATIKQWKLKQDVVKTIIEIRGLSKLISSYLRAECFVGNMMRSIYNVAGTKNSRWSATTYIDDSGVNPQTFPREDIYIPDTLKDLTVEELRIKSGVDNVINEILSMELDDGD